MLCLVLAGSSGAVQAETPAPFGLTWGASVAEVRAAGVVLQRRNSDQSGVRLAANKLPKPLSDLGETILSFGNNDQLQKIEAIGEDVSNDPSGTRLKARYAALARALASKYGNGKSRHEIRMPFDRQNDFLMGIHRGFSHWYTDYVGDNVTVRLEIRASRRGISNYVLTFEHKKTQQGNRSLQDKDAL